MRTRTVVGLLAVLVTTALGVGPATAAHAVTFTNAESEPLEVGSEIKGEAGGMYLSIGGGYYADCIDFGVPEEEENIEISGELTQNEDEPAKATMQFPVFSCMDGYGIYLWEFTGMEINPEFFANGAGDTSFAFDSVNWYGSNGGKWQPLAQCAASGSGAFDGFGWDGTPASFGFQETVQLSGSGCPSSLFLNTTQSPGISLTDGEDQPIKIEG